VSVASGSLTGLPAFHRDFDLPLPNVRHLTAPHFWRSARPSETEDDFSERLAQEFEALILNEGAETIAAFIAEPVMGAGGVVPPPAGYWPRMQALCRKHDILLIADEVITGFGRTGAMFASHKYGIEPDVLVVSKALTSSYFPLSAVLVSDPLNQAVADNSARIGTFAHGFTASGHPVGAAVAMENLDIIEERDLVGRARALEPRFQRRIAEFADHPLVGEARGVGLIGGIEIVRDKATREQFEPTMKVAAQVAANCAKHGLMLRPLPGDVVGICPPLIIEDSEIDELFDRLQAALDDTAGVMALAA
jgi:4-aminobutyrate---pyruvate transaminase